MKRKLICHLIGLGCLSLPILTTSACSLKATKTNINGKKQVVSNNHEKLDLCFLTDSINVLVNKSYQSKEIQAKYKDDYHECDFEIINSLPWMSIKNNCFYIDGSIKNEGIYYPSIIAKSKTIVGLSSQPMKLTINIKRQNPSFINKITWTNCKETYTAVAGEEYQICPIDLDFDTSLPIEQAINKVKIKVNVINNKSIDTNGNDLFYTKLIDGKFYLYISPYTLNAFTDYLTNYQLEIVVVNNNQQDQKIYLKQILNVNVIEGLRYEEDGLVFARKSPKDNWTLTAISLMKKEINFDQPKMIYNHLVDKIGPDAANGHDNLVSIRINYPIEEIGNSGFCMCKNLVNVEVNVKRLDNFAFLNCKAIKTGEIIVGESIGISAFKNCPNLTNCITLGEDFKSFHASSFVQNYEGLKPISHRGINIRQYLFIVNVACSIPPLVITDPLINFEKTHPFVLSLADNVNTDIFFKQIASIEITKRGDYEWWANLKKVGFIWTKEYCFNLQIQQMHFLESPEVFFRYIGWNKPKKILSKNR